MSTSCFDIDILLYFIQLKDSSLLLTIVSWIVFVDSGIYYKYGKNNLQYPKNFALAASLYIFGSSFSPKLFVFS